MARQRELGVEVASSQANFCWLGLPGHDEADAAQIERGVVETLGRQGVLVRAGTALGRSGWLRVTYGTPAQNARFLAALEQALAP